MPGKVAGSKRYFHGGFCYHQDNRNNLIFRCSTRSTSGCVGKLKLDESFTNVVKLTDHDDCEEDLNLYLREKFKEACVEEALISKLDCIDIYKAKLIE